MKEHRGVRAAQGSRRFAQASGWKQFVVQVTFREQDDIKVTVQAPVLKSIIE
jgi:hypothetical protein